MRVPRVVSAAAVLITFATVAGCGEEGQSGSKVTLDEHSSGERVQVQLTYRLTGVPGSAAKQLVRQARDAWVKRGYRFQSSDADWNDPYPTVSMRTEPDDFWMDAITGVLDKEKGTGVPSLGVTSPCFRPSDATALRSGPAPLAPPGAPTV